MLPRNALACRKKQRAKRLDVSFLGVEKIVTPYYRYDVADGTIAAHSSLEIRRIPLQDSLTESNRFHGPEEWASWDRPTDTAAGR
jgi:hypothetical protein